MSSRVATGANLVTMSMAMRFASLMVQTHGTRSPRCPVTLVEYRANRSAASGPSQPPSCENHLGNEKWL